MDEVFTKDFDGWNTEKKRLESKSDLSRTHAKVNEFWLIKCGANIWGEICGKDSQFFRPIMIISVFEDWYFAVPLTTKNENNDPFKYPIHSSLKLREKGSHIVLNQARYISWKRLFKKMNTGITIQEVETIHGFLKENLFPTKNKKTSQNEFWESDPSKRKLWDRPEQISKLE